MERFTKTAWITLFMILMILIYTAGDLASFVYGSRLSSIDHTRCLRGHGSKNEARVAAACISSTGFINDTSSSMESLSSILKYEKMSCDSDIFQSEDVVADLGLDQRAKGNKTRWCCCRRCCGYAVNCRRIPGCPSC